MQATEIKRMTYKAFRELLNKTYGFTDERWGTRGKFGAQKRLYGDYLYAQDKVMFMDVYNRFYEDPYSCQDLREAAGLKQV